MPAKGSSHSDLLQAGHRCRDRSRFISFHPTKLSHDGRPNEDMDYNVLGQCMAYADTCANFAYLVGRNVLIKSKFAICDIIYLGNVNNRATRLRRRGMWSKKSKMCLYWDKYLGTTDCCMRTFSMGQRLEKRRQKRRKTPCREIMSTLASELEEKTRDVESMVRLGESTVYPDFALYS